MEEWCTIESDPGVFHEMIENLGVRGVEVKELWSMDRDSLLAIEDLHGLVFLFKWQKESNVVSKMERGSQGCQDQAWFARQMINNACATIAIVNVLMNAPHLDLGPELSQLKSFTSEMDSELKGLAISNSEVIRTIHNSFAKPEPMIEEHDKDEKGGEAFHFISYIVHSDTVYELDGLKQEPIPLGLCSESNRWIDIVASALNERVSRYDAELRFTLLAICGDGLQAAKAKMTELESMMEDGTVVIQMESLRETIEEETAKRAKWKTDNIRRRHNYLPLLANTLEFLAENGELRPLIDRARDLINAKNSNMSS